MAPTGLTWIQLTMLYGDSTAECVAHSDVQPGWSQGNSVWENLDQPMIDKSIDHWRDKLKAIVRLNGEHTEQLFWLSEDV